MEGTEAPGTPLTGSQVLAATVSTPGLILVAIAFAAAAILLTAAFTFGLLPKALDAPTIGWPWALGLTIAGGVLGQLTMIRLARQVGALEDEAEKLAEPARSTKLYGIYLVGIGFALLMQALACSFVFVGISWSEGRRHDIIAARAAATATAAVPVTARPAGQTPDEGFDLLFGKNKDEALSVAGLFILSTLVAIVGAFFYFANSLYQKMDEPTRDPFDRQVFWGGLWFRIGEAVLFNLVFFLVIRSNASGRTLILPLVSLLVGMFLKAGETLVSGIATRVFAAMQSLVPADFSKKEIKLLAFHVAGFPANATPDVVKGKLTDMATAIKSLAGVSQVESDETSKTARVEYDASTVSQEDIRRKVELKGLEMI
jgi:hypothetical protein